MIYKIILTILGETRESEGATVDEALVSFNLKWIQIKGKGVLTVFYGSQSHEHLFTMFHLRRIFANRVVREHWARNLEYLLKADNQSNIPKYDERITGGANKASVDIDTTAKVTTPARRGRKAKSPTGGGGADTKTA